MQTSYHGNQYDNNCLYFQIGLFLNERGYIYSVIKTINVFHFFKVCIVGFDVIAHAPVLHCHIMHARIVKRRKKSS